MNKLWSLFWLVVATSIAVVVITSLIAPYFWIILVIFIVVVIGIVIYKVWNFVNGFRGMRRHF